MIMKRFKYVMIICVALASILVACEEENKTIWFENETGETILLFDNSYIDDNITLSPSVVFSKFEIPQKILNKGKYHHALSEYTVGQMRKGRKIQLLIFKESTFEKYSKRELMEQNIYDKHYALSYDDLKACGFKIVYRGE